MSQKLDFGKIKEIQNPTLQQLGRPHVDSFNYMTNGGLEKAVADLDPAEFQLNDDKIKIEIEAVAWSCPAVPPGTPGVNMTGVRGRVYPKECRLRAVTYKGKFMAKINWYVNGELRGTCEKDMGNLPVMVKSNRCNLNFMSPEELVKRGEHENEWGGYFVVKGHERLIRMLVMNRRHFPIAMRRNGWKNRGENFSDMGIQIRCVQDDQTATTNVLHYVNDGTVKLMFMHKKACYFAPLILIMKCIGVYADFHIYEKLIAGFEDDMYFVSCVENMLRALHTDLDLHTTDDCRNYLGKMFRVKLLNDVPEWYTDRQIAAYMLKRCVLVHLKSKQDKLNMLVYMTQKLFAFAQNKCVHEGADSVMMQEVLMGGHLYLMAMKEKLQGWLRNVKLNIKRQAGGKPAYQLTEAEVLKAVRRAAGMEQMMEMFLATGNLKSMEGSGLMQNTGLTIVAENINRMRYMSHFRSIHRGAFFQEMRTTEVRRLLPDAWGFICPVHTPDGAPCGLLNHLTMDCVITDVPDADKVNNIKPFLVRYGLRPIDESNPQYKECLTVLLDGRVLGHLPDRLVSSVVGHLRKTKIEGEELPQMLEIALVTKEDAAGQFPGLYLFTGPARMMRPVVNLSTKTIEYIGTFEQVYMEVAVSAKDFKENLTTHMEISQIGFLSNLARLIPLPDYNQSPRNMYQCQMGKQSMGTPCHNWRQQSAGKLYRLQTPQSPLFKPQHYDDVDMDDFAMGSNAIIAVMCDTGYDMEDAMVINKMSEERGLAHGSIQKSDLIVLDSHVNSYFFRDRHKPELCQYLDNDGLPFLGRKLVYGEPYYCYYNAEKDCHTVKNFAGKEECIVDSVMLIGTLDDRKYRSVRINVIVPRNPSVGDKFASRAGQKGICSQKWPMENLPFTETGMVPDIVFNPHGFPSRMTIAMMIEVMAGKSACVHGTSHDATPFRYSQEDDYEEEEEEEGDTPTTAMEYFARQLEQAGYNYYGTETMYSGISGEELKTQIFFGMVHYQRLRHMVSDKWQVRSTGPIDTLTKQPLKGRRRGGGVRFGEMERDALLSHGASYLLQDRLFLNSDKCVAHVCMSCNNMMGTTSVVTKPSDIPNQSECKEVCFLCRSHDNVQPVFVPYIFLYFQKQLTMLGITLVTELKEV